MAGNRTHASSNLQAARWRGSGSRVPPFAWEAALGAAAIFAITFFAQWHRWPAPVALFLYLVVIAAIVIGFFSSRVASQAKEKERWREQLHSLYEFTRQSLLLSLNLAPGQQLADLIHEIFAFEAVALFDADLHQVYRAGYWTVDPQEMAQNAYYFETTDDDPKSGIGRRVVRLGSVPVGGLVVRGETSPLTNNAIAAIVAITFDRYRAFANENRMETERRAEQLRATVLDNLAHAYKTPLTAIRAAGTGLVEIGKLSPAQAELVAVINEETRALNDLTTRLLTTARLDAGEITLHAAPVNVASMIEEILISLKDRLASMKVIVDMQDDNLELNCDRQLITMLLSQYIDNACKYSNYGTAITIGAEATPVEVVFSVHSHGAVIPMADRERIFERYYRSARSSHAPGTGIGLSVARRVAEAHGGHTWVTSGEEEGTTFFAAIPRKSRRGSAA